MKRPVYTAVICSGDFLFLSILHLRAVYICAAENLIGVIVGGDGSKGSYLWKQDCNGLDTAACLADCCVCVCVCLCVWCGVVCVCVVSVCVVCV